MEDSNLKYLKLFTKKLLNSSENSLIQHLFGGKIQSCLTCDVCKKKSIKIEDFLDVSLVSNINSDLLGSLKEFYKHRRLLQELLQSREIKRKQ